MSRRAPPSSARDFVAPTSNAPPRRGEGRLPRERFRRDGGASKTRAMPQMSFRRQGRLIVVMHTATAASADEWSGYLAMLTSMISELQLSPMAPTALVFTDGAAPSAEQRRSFIDLVGKRRFQSSVVTTSRFTRGIVTALSWFTPGVRAYDPDDAAAILQHVGIGSYDLPVMMAMAEELAADVGGVGVYDRFAAALEQRG